MRIEPWKRNLLALFVAQTMAMVAFSFVFPFFPLYIQHLGVPDVTAAAQWAGVIGAAAALSMAITQPIWGSLADRYGRKPMVIRSMVGASIVILLMGLATSPEQLLVMRLIQGAVSGTIAASNALVATGTPKDRLGFALGIMQVAMFTGSSVGPLTGGLLADQFGFQTAFFAASILMLLGTVIVVAFVRESFVRPAPAPGAGNAWSESRALLSLSLFPLLIGVIFMIQFGNMILTPILSLFISDLNGGADAATAAGVVLAATGAVSAVSALAIGRVSDRIGHKVILPICLIGAAICYFPQALVQQVWQLLLLRMVMGMFLGGLMPSANALVAGIVPRQRRGAAFGLTATASAMANFAAPISGAEIATYLGMRTVFLVTGGLFTLTSLWALLGFRRYAPPPQALGTGIRPLDRREKSSIEGQERSDARESGTGADSRQEAAPRNGHVDARIERR